jgi:hypothetical protein
MVTLFVYGFNYYLIKVYKTPTQEQPTTTVQQNVTSIYSNNTKAGLQQAT